jgi:asparagine synthase (glutamine-hydrolysing)
MGNLSLSYSGMELLPQLLAQGRLARLMQETALLFRNGTRAGTIAAKTIGPFLPGIAWRAIRVLRGRGGSLAAYSAVNTAAAKGADMEKRARERGHDLLGRPARDSVAMRIWALGRQDLGCSVKGVLAGWGLDMRDPTVDKRLVEFCLSVPLEQFMRAGVPRALVRDALADRLPQAVLRERLRGYQAVDWHEALSGCRSELREEVERIKASNIAVEALDLARMSALIDDWPSGSWHRKNVEQNYRQALLRGVTAGHFIRKVSGVN